MSFGETFRLEIDLSEDIYVLNSIELADTYNLLSLRFLVKACIAG